MRELERKTALGDADAKAKLTAARNRSLDRAIKFRQEMLDVNKRLANIWGELVNLRREYKTSDSLEDLKLLVLTQLISHTSSAIQLSKSLLR